MAARDKTGQKSTQELAKDVNFKLKYNISEEDSNIFDRLIVKPSVTRLTLMSEPSGKFRTFQDVVDEYIIIGKHLANARSDMVHQINSLFLPCHERTVPLFLSSVHAPLPIPPRSSNLVYHGPPPPPPPALPSPVILCKKNGSGLMTSNTTARAMAFLNNEDDNDEVRRSLKLTLSNSGKALYTNGVDVSLSWGHEVVLLAKDEEIEFRALTNQKDAIRRPATSQASEEEPWRVTFLKDSHVRCCYIITKYLTERLAVREAHIKIVLLLNRCKQLYNLLITNAEFIDKKGVIRCSAGFLLERTESRLEEMMQLTESAEQIEGIDFLAIWLHIGMENCLATLRDSHKQMLETAPGEPADTKWGVHRLFRVVQLKDRLDALLENQQAVEEEEEREQTLKSLSKEAGMFLKRIAELWAKFLKKSEDGPSASEDIDSISSIEESKLTLRKTVLRLDVEWFLFVHHCEEKVPDIKCKLLKATASGYQLQPYFEQIETLKEEFLTRDWKGGMLRQGKVVCEAFEDEHEAEINVEKPDVKKVKELIAKHGEMDDMCQSPDYQAYCAKVLKELEAKVLENQRRKQEEKDNDSQSNVSGDQETKADLTDGELTRGSISTTEGNNGAASQSEGESQLAQLLATNNLDINAISFTANSRLKRCSRQDCGKLEAFPREFQVCQECRSDSKKFGSLFVRSYYCRSSCYEIDWKLRHKRYHRQWRRNWRKEVENEEDEVRGEEGAVGGSERSEETAGGAEKPLDKLVYDFDNLHVDEFMLMCDVE